VPDLSAALASYSDEELAELFAAFDLEVRYHKRADTAEISIALCLSFLPGSPHRQIASAPLKQLDQPKGPVREVDL
jgi:hypothetical protein